MISNFRTVCKDLAFMGFVTVDSLVNLEQQSGFSKGTIFDENVINMNQ